MRCQDGAKGDKDLGAVVHQYDATMSPCFGELALMYVLFLSSPVRISLLFGCNQSCGKVAFGFLK
jgi:hypothetical protein